MGAAEHGRGELVRLLLRFGADMEARDSWGQTALFRAAERWARGRGCLALKVETQNVNVPACRFYARMGCALRSINRAAYPELPGEIQMLWWKELST